MRLPRQTRLCAASLALLLLSPGPALAEGLQCSELPNLFRAFEVHHYAVRAIDAAMQERTVDQLVKELDPSKTLLLDGEVVKLRAELGRVFVTMQSGNCALLDDAWQLILNRVQEDERVVQEMLGATYTLDEQAVIVLDADERQFAKTAAERLARVRTMVHFQISNYLISGLALEAAKQHLVHRYALATKRVLERQQKHELPELCADAFAQALDPHSAYMSAEQLADFNVQMRLSLEGIGAVLRWDDGFTLIESLVPGGQADKTHLLRPKDRIVAVADGGSQAVSTIDMDLTDVVKLIRGKKGTKVTLTVLRDGGEHSKTFKVTIVRDKIDIASQAAKLTYQTRKLGPRAVKIGVIDLPSFYGGEDGGRSSTADVKRLLGEAVAQKVDGVVLDLSRNGGGLLDEAVHLGGLFIKRGAIVGTKARQGRLEVLEDEDDSVTYTGPLAVLISSASASASEIVAGALQDYHRAVIVGGAHSFGKGTVQVVVPLSAEIGAIRVTTGMFFLPGGQSTQHNGVSADIRVPTLFDGGDLGEGKLEYSLPAQAVASFLSPDANGQSAVNSWRPVPSSLVAALAKRSSERIAKDAGFANLKKELADAERNKGSVRVGDLMRRSKESGHGDAVADNTRFEALQAVTLAEAVSIVADEVTELGVRTAAEASRPRATP